MNDEERLAEIDAVLDELSETDRVILVEGKNDRRALVSLGLTDIGTIEVQKEGGPIRAAERLFEMKKDAIILTDWDDRGDRIAEDLKHHLNGMCVRYDVKLRARLRAACIKDIKDVESLDSFYKRLKTSLL